MLSSQIAYYNALSEEDKSILQAAALESCFYIEYGFIHKMESLFNRKFVIKKISGIINNAVKHDFFLAETGWKTKYTVSPEFLVFIFPEINYHVSLRKQLDLDNKTFRFANSPLELFRNCLHKLVYKPELYAEVEKYFLTYAPEFVLYCYTILIADERYEPYLSKISKDIIYHIFVQTISEAIKNLVALPELHARIKKIESSANYPELSERCKVKMNELFLKGKIGEASEMDPDKFDYRAIKCLFDGNIEESVALFKKYIKEQTREGAKKPLPSNTYIAYFYIIALLLSDSSISTPVFQKTIQFALKDPGRHFDLYTTIAYEALNEQKDKLSGLKQTIQSYITDDEISSLSLEAMLIYYLIGEKMDDKHSLHIYHIIKKAVDAE